MGIGRAWHDRTENRNACASKSSVVVVGWLGDHFRDRDPQPVTPLPFRDDQKAISAAPSRTCINDVN